MQRSDTFLKDPGCKIVLKPYGDRWKAIERIATNKNKPIVYIFY